MENSTPSGLAESNGIMHGNSRNPFVSKLQQLKNNDTIGTSSNNVKKKGTNVIPNRTTMLQPIASPQALTKRQLGRRRRRQRRRQRKQEQKRLQRQQEQQVSLPKLRASDTHHQKVNSRWPTSPDRSHNRWDHRDSDPTGCPEFLYENWSDSETQLHESQKLERRQQWEQEQLLQLDNIEQYHTHLISQDGKTNGNPTITSDEISQRFMCLDINMKDNE